jgi:hypothetical protein
VIEPIAGGAELARAVAADDGGEHGIPAHQRTPGRAVIRGRHRP